MHALDTTTRNSDALSFNLLSVIIIIFNGGVNTYCKNAIC